MDAFKTRLLTLPEGASEVRYQGRRYLLTKATIVQGGTVKLYARELGGNDIVSGNYFVNIKGGLLKPCEMAKEKVIDFVLGLE